MSDQALAWKAGFGALVLLFCAGTWWVRKPAHEPVVPAQTSRAASSQPALPDPPQAADPAPLDVQDDTPPVRVQVTLHDEEPAAAPTYRKQYRSKLRVPAPQMLRAARPGAPRVHTVAARRRSSPYAIGRKHYPMGPGERWAMRDAP